MAPGRQARGAAPLCRTTLIGLLWNLDRSRAAATVQPPTSDLPNEPLRTGCQAGIRTRTKGFKARPGRYQQIQPCPEKSRFSASIDDFHACSSRAVPPRVAPLGAKWAQYGHVSLLVVTMGFSLADVPPGVSSRRRECGAPWGICARRAVPSSARRAQIRPTKRRRGD